MRVLSASQVKAWDQFTIENEPISSLDLMERAAAKAVGWILENMSFQSATIVCGKGNNGGDGMVMAQMLDEKGWQIQVVTLDDDKGGSKDYLTNKQYCQKSGIEIFPLDKADLEKYALIIDCVFGTGYQSRDTHIPPIISMVNNAQRPVVSIDVPSGLGCEQFSDVTEDAVKADVTLTFQCPKVSFINRDNHSYLGRLVVLDIGLHANYKAEGEFVIVDSHLASQYFQPRTATAEKRTLGSALLVGGNTGMAGAIVLAAKAALYSGCGLTYALTAEGNRVPLQVSVPEAIYISDKDLSTEMLKYKTLGIGPGLGQEDFGESLLEFGLSQNQPMAIDADALNIIASKGWLNRIPKDSILTPHKREFERLFGETTTDEECFALQQQKAKELELHILLKGNMTRICHPDGSTSVCIVGNAGLAKGGSGDVLTGLITGLLAQGYAPKEASSLGAYIHGKAADLAALDYSQNCITATNLIATIPKVFRLLEQKVGWLN